MIEDCFEIRATPVINVKWCPIKSCGGNMIEMQNGWFSSAWYCEKCKRVFKLKLSPMREKNINRAEVEKQIKKHIENNCNT